MKQGTAIANGASGPSAKFSAKKLARIPAMMAEINLSESSESGKNFMYVCFVNTDFILILNFLNL
jgi:hypothetical protein